MFDNITKKPVQATPSQDQTGSVSPNNAQPATSLNKTVSVNTVQQKTSSSSSPWEDDLDLPEETKNQPRIIGSLDPNGQASGVFNIPNNVDEKVGKKIPAVEAIKKSTISSAPQPVAPSPNPAPTVAPTKPALNVTPAPTVVNQVASQDKSLPLAEDFDWFGDGITTSTNAQPASPAANNNPQKTTPIAPANPVTTPPSPSISNSTETYTPIDPFAVSDKEEDPSSLLSTSTNSGVPPVSSAVKPAAPAEAIPEKKLSKYLHFFNLKAFSIFIGVIFIIFILSVILTESGFLNIGAEKIYGAIGLERLWGGLSKNPENALLKSLSVMKGNTNFKVSGTVDMTIDSGVKSQVTSPLVSAKATDGNFIKETSSSILFSTNGQKSLADITITSDLGQNKIEFQNDGSKIYVKGNDKIVFSNNTDPTKWVAYTISNSSIKTAPADIFNIDTGSGASVSGSRLKSEKISGENCFHYKIDSMEVGDALAALGIKGEMIQSVSGDIWIGIKDKLIKKVTLKVIPYTSSPVALMNADLTFYDYGVTNEIQEISYSEIADLSQKVLTGDEKRKDDLNQLSTALAKYKEANGAYPTSSNVLVSLGSTSNMLVSTLVPSYLSEFPYDNKASSGWYYAYKSDGASFSLSARLENTSDPDGTSVGGVFLYLKNSL